MYNWRKEIRRHLIIIAATCLVGYLLDQLMWAMMILLAIYSATQLLPAAPALLLAVPGPGIKAPRTPGKLRRLG